jgi:hypothetical protein
MGIWVPQNSQDIHTVKIFLGIYIPYFFTGIHVYIPQNSHAFLQRMHLGIYGYAGTPKYSLDFLQVSQVSKYT